MRDSEGRPSKAKFRPTQIRQRARQESAVEFSWEVGQVEAAHDCRIDGFYPPRIGRGKYRFECPNKNSKVRDPAPTPLVLPLAVEALWIECSWVEMLRWCCS